MSVSLLHSFTGQPTEGSNPNASVIYQDGKLYGTTYSGGTDDKGTLFRYTVASNSLDILHNFTGTGGRNPVASVIYQDGILYGTAQGGSSGSGILFSYNLDSPAFTILHTFTGNDDDGANPFTSVIYQGRKLYGTTNVGGTYEKGTLFSYDLDSPAFTTLYSFTGTGTEGANPDACVIYQGGKLYGTTGRGGGTDNKGTLFSYEIGGTLTTLASFTGREGVGAYPHAELIYQDGILYGTTDSGGDSSSGTIFSYDLGLGELTTLHSFTGTGTDGSTPRAIIHQGGILYGTTVLGDGGGTDDKGTIFSYDLDSLAVDAFTTLYSFDGTVGANPVGVIYQSGKLYGTTYSSNNNGTIFSYTITTVPISNICFPAGTLISTDQGEIRIEKIIPFENTIDNKNIKAITKTISQDTYLVCFDENALGKNYPNKKTMISKYHKILYKGKMIEAYKFLGHFEKVQKVDYNQEILYNVLMEKYEKIKVNNIMCETLHPNNIIAKLYSDYEEEYKNKIIYIMNESINKNDKNSYIKIINRI
jgi:uncharacterized repeat protein (TIGR03803 family)